jgi:hypothetical protein
MNKKTFEVQRIDSEISLPLVFKENPFNQNVLNAVNILEIGGGAGAKVPWILSNTKAKYTNIEPDAKLRDSFNKSFAACDRVSLYSNFEEIPSNVKFDVVVSTFFLENIGFLPGPDIMNVNDITSEAFAITADGGIWIMIEDEKQDPLWLFSWMKANELYPDVFVPFWNVAGRCSLKTIPLNGTRHLVIFNYNPQD